MSTLSQTALIIASDAAVRNSLCMLLDSYGLATKCYTHAADCLRELDDADESRLLIAYQRTSARGLDFVRKLRDLDSELPVIILAGRIDFASRQNAARFDAMLIEAPPEEGMLCRAIETILQAGAGMHADSLKRR